MLRLIRDRPYGIYAHEIPMSIEHLKRSVEAANARVVLIEDPGDERQQPRLAAFPAPSIRETTVVPREVVERFHRETKLPMSTLARQRALENAGRRCFEAERLRASASEKNAELERVRLAKEKKDKDRAAKKAKKAEKAKQCDAQQAPVGKKPTPNRKRGLTNVHLPDLGR